MGMPEPRNLIGAMLMSLMASHRVQLDPHIKVVEKEEPKPRKCLRCDNTSVNGFCSPECARKVRLAPPIAGRRGKGTRKQRKVAKQR